MSLALTSSAFTHNGSMPVAHTCEGANSSPPLEWSGVPSGTKSLALIVDDPDAPDPKAPKRTYVHWVLYDIPVSLARLPAATKTAPSGAQDGLNDRNEKGYRGPCPPIGRHRYFFKLYALDTLLGDLGDGTKAVLEGAMKGHILAHTELIGTYQKSGGQ